MADELVSKIADVIAEHETSADVAVVDAAESAVALAEAQAALANTQAAQVVADAKSETDKLKECLECLTNQQQELKAELATIRLQLSETESRLSTQQPQPEVVIVPQPEPTESETPETLSQSSSIGVEAENPEAKTHQQKSRRRLI